jgi:trehalose-6-phosphate synthase
VQLLLSVDRLDYTKGMPERLHTFAALLEQHPNLLRRVSLVQVAVPSRTEVPQYAQLKREVDELVGQINGRFARPGWTPIHYLYRSFDLSDLVALYGLADVALITPLRDGMNLVAHEFAAARLDNRGVLVLSEFAGAATILDGAVLVNPHDYPRTADTIASALSMSPEQQEERMRRLGSAVRRHKVGFWQHAFLNALESHDGSPQSTRH